MSVLEFFTAYWDWYLLVGFLFVWPILKQNEDASRWGKFGGALFAIFLWPVCLLLGFLKD